MTRGHHGQDLDGGTHLPNLTLTGESEMHSTHKVAVSVAD
jgi:hypothetical protein